MQFSRQIQSSLYETPTGVDATSSMNLNYKKPIKKGGPIYSDLLLFLTGAQASLSIQCLRNPACEILQRLIQRPHGLDS